jgi:hypothetical protein
MSDNDWGLEERKREVGMSDALVTNSFGGRCQDQYEDLEGAYHSAVLDSSRGMNSLGVFVSLNQNAFLK